jgi:enterochelin esterase-like enzyme
MLMWSSLRVYLDVGRNDSLAPEVKAFAAALETHGLKPAFHLYPGGHDRAYWRAHTAEYLAFYAADW